MYIHNTNYCACEMCVWADRQELEQQQRASVTLEPVAAVLDDIDLVLQSLAQPNFDADWKASPRGMRNYVEQSIAEYWWTRGKQAGERASVVTAHSDLKQMSEMMKGRLEHDER